MKFRGIQAPCGPVVLTFLIFLIICAWPLEVRAEKPANQPVTKQWLKKRFIALNKRLDKLEEKQKEILAGQALLQEEHKVLRFRVNRA